MEVPVCLLTIDPTGHIEINQEALSLLSSITEKLCVISIAGAARTGKSYLLNRVMGTQHGFDIGASTESCTKGIWLWGAQATLSQNKRLVLLDTEGLHSKSRSETTDMVILSLAVLLSSVFVYNSMLGIGESSIEDLSLVCNLAESIHAKDAFPRFVWTLRDFSLELVDSEGIPTDANGYMEDCLRVVNSNDPETIRKNEIRKTMLMFFKERFCFTFPRPLVDERKLNRIERLEYESLDGEFREEVQNFVQFLLGKPTVKKIEGVPITGKMFVGLLCNYVDTFNSRGIPTISTAWESVVFAELKDTFNSALEMYRHQTMLQIKNHIPIEEQMLRKMESSIRNGSMEQVLNTYVVPALIPERDKLASNLKTRCEEILNDLLEQNARESQMQALKETKVHFEALENRLLASEEFSWVAEEFSAIYTKVTQTVQGPGVFKNLAKEYSKEGSRLIVKLISQIQRHNKEKVAKVEKRHAEEISEFKVESDMLKRDNADLASKKVKDPGRNDLSDVSLAQENQHLRAEIAKLRQKIDSGPSNSNPDLDNFQKTFRSLIHDFKSIKAETLDLEVQYEYEHKQTELENSQKKEILKQKRDYEKKLNEQKKEADTKIANLQRENLRIQETLRKIVNDIKQRDIEIKVYKEKMRKNQIMEEARAEQGELIITVSNLVDAIIDKLESRDYPGVRHDIEELRGHASRNR